MVVRSKPLESFIMRFTTTRKVYKEVDYYQIYKDHNVKGFKIQKI